MSDFPKTFSKVPFCQKVNRMKNRQTAQKKSHDNYDEGENFCPTYIFNFNI